MSNISTWLGPPHWNRKITRLARTRGAATPGFTESAARSRRGIVRPRSPAPPTRIIARREMLVLQKSRQAKCDMSSSSRLVASRMAIGRDADRVRRRVGRNGQLHKVALAVFFLVGNVFV